MITISTIKEVDEELFANISDVAREELSGFPLSGFRFMNEQWVAKDGTGQAILFIFIYAPCIIMEYAELWLIPTKRFQAFHITECKSYLPFIQKFYPDLFVAIPKGFERERKLAKHFGYSTVRGEEDRNGKIVVLYGAD